MKRRITAKQKYTTYANYPLVSGDVRAYELCLDLGKDVEGAQFKVTAIRADGEVIEDIGNVENGMALYTMASNMYSVPGTLVVRLAVLQDMSVLTDREIVFDVLEGKTSTDSPETVVPINDSIILRLGNIEQKLSGKVDKEEGKGLSSNDFADSYKAKLDNLDDTIGSEVERISETVDDLSDEFDSYKEDVTSKLSLKADKTTTTDLQRQINNKANRSDISNVYKFKGSVDSFDNLPQIIRFEANGDPTDQNGTIIGTFSHETGEITFDNFTATIERNKSLLVKIPVKPVEIKEGYYWNPAVNMGDIQIEHDGGDHILSIDNISDIYVVHGTPSSIPAQTITHICLDITADYYATLEGLANVTISGTGKITGTLEKTPQINDWDYMYVSDLSVGDVYNAVDTDMNYAWTGAEWDRLGGAHKDMEARAQIGDIETALDSIIEIQNSLIGGEVE